MCIVSTDRKVDVINENIKFFFKKTTKDTSLS